MAGRRPKPIQLRLLQGNPGKRAIRGVFEPPRPPQPPDPPPFLSGDALAEWKRVAPGLALFGLLSNFDVMPLAAYCVAYQRWREAEELLKQLANVDDKAHGLLVKGSKNQAKANPLIRSPAKRRATWSESRASSALVPRPGVGSPSARAAGFRRSLRASSRGSSAAWTTTRAPPESGGDLA